MYHPRLKGTAYEMGQKMGTIFKKSHAHFPIQLDPFQIRFGKESGTLLKQFFPEATEEIRGITDVLGIDNDIFTAWMMCMGCCLDIHDGKSMETRGCTVFSYLHNGRTYHARNNDLPPFLKKVSKSIYYQPEHRNHFILNTSSFINGEEGINEQGFVAAMTFVVPQLNEIQPGINSVFLVRYLLENCNSVAEGLAALRKLPIASSCNIILTDKEGNMAAAECNPLEIHVRQPEKNNQGEPFLVAVNHFTSPHMRKHEGGEHNISLAETRYQTAYRALKGLEDSDSVKFAQAILSGKHGFLCQYEQQANFDTIWSSVFAISDQKIYRAEGNPKSTSFKEDMRLEFTFKCR
ncbi:MAG: acyl-CoA--6-aminopenicillanic acid acyl-transferase [Pelolinea sp.]|nr:acyl-CoA--6-aminopenicillanic acid acyl-transferase [Pelolinea sp.]